ncbi:CheR family methyltransferase [Parvibaculum sp.]|uniref:CheR family methyltransferase n=1 Tax=Parvibaculum sp. TaxID=2024848 RepID=UPI00391A9029
MLVSGSNELIPVPDGEFAFTWSEFREIAALIHGEAGIVLSEGKVNLVYSRLAKRLRAIGLRSFREYCELLKSKSGNDERQAMISAITTNVTRFFREPHHFDFLRESVFPSLVSRARSGERVRLWSAGCSSGEEPYSIAMTLLAMMPDALSHDILILATDIDPEMIKRGKAAAYSQSQAASIPDEFRTIGLEKGRGGPDVRISECVRALIRFNELNLLGAWPMKGQFDVIFCRNVVIYFDEETQDEIWGRFARMMPDGAFLCIGHSERVPADRHPFELVAQTIYRKRGN